MKLFDLDSPLMQFLNKVADMMWLNILLYPDYHRGPGPDRPALYGAEDSERRGVLHYQGLF